MDHESSSRSLLSNLSPNSSGMVTPAELTDDELDLDSPEEVIEPLETPLNFKLSTDGVQTSSTPIQERRGRPRHVSVSLPSDGPRAVSPETATPLRPIPHSSMVVMQDEVPRKSSMSAGQPPLFPRLPRHVQSPPLVPVVARLSEAHKMSQVKGTNVAFGEERITEETREVCEMLNAAVRLRGKYVSGHVLYPWEVPPESPLDPSIDYDPESPSFPPASSEVFGMIHGVMKVYASEPDREADNRMLPDPHDFHEFYQDMKQISRAVGDQATKSFAYTRLKLLEAKFELHKTLNEVEELQAQKSVPHRDFYNCRKVDTHVHLASAMNQKHLLRFIKKKLKTCPEEVVIFRDGKQMTLAQVFKSLNLTAYDLSVDTLDVHADKSTFHRFDKFNLKYNPFGQSRLRDVFIKTDNLINGRYFAELVKEIFADMEDSKYQMTEPRVSIYGRSKGEWDKLASWVINNKVISPNVRWLIQIPRLYPIIKDTKSVQNFGEMLRNIFEPLFEVTRDPSSHPELHQFLKRVGGIDSVDDESKIEKRFHSRLPKPENWTTSDNPPYPYYTYYMYANIFALNQYRKQRGMSTFEFRPHAGEAGEYANMVSTFLVADSIAHGIMLRKYPVLQYLYYLTQIGLAMSPLSSNSLFINYSRNPFPQFFARGLNVSLSTDDPLMFHFTKEPLIEEYSVAAQVFYLSNCDLCEIAHNSVLQSGFEPPVKAYWLGENYYLPGPLGNNIERTNVPNIRIAFRHETLIDEHLFIQKALLTAPPGTIDPKSLPLTVDEFLALAHRSKPEGFRSVTFAPNPLTPLLQAPEFDEDHSISMVGIIARHPQSPKKAAPSPLMLGQRGAHIEDKFQLQPPVPQVQQTPGRVHVFEMTTRPGHDSHDIHLKTLAVDNSNLASYRVITQSQLREIDIAEKAEATASQEKSSRRSQIVTAVVTSALLVLPIVLAHVLRSKN